MTTQVQHIPRSAGTSPWPSPSDDAGWSDPDIATRLAHPSVHPVPQPGCHLCPPVPCRCGATACPEVFEHSRTYAGAEITAWEMAA